MDWKLSNLISVGTGVCGGSAIAAVSPIIKAKDEDIAYALSTTFIFDILIGNVDRHLFNFGIIECDNFVDIAPIFDNEKIPRYL